MSLSNVMSLNSMMSPQQMSLTKPDQAEQLARPFEQALQAAQEKLQQEQSVQSQLAQASEMAADSEKKSTELQDAIQQFVGQTFFGQMMKEMRKSVPKSDYFNGGNAEDIFQQQMDQIMCEKLADTSAGRMSNTVYKQFDKHLNQSDLGPMASK